MNSEFIKATNLIKSHLKNAVIQKQRDKANEYIHKCYQLVDELIEIKT